MGFFDFFKKLVNIEGKGREEKKEADGGELSFEVKFSEIAKFTAPLEKESVERVNSAAAEFYSEIFEKKEELKELSEELKKFDLNKRKEPEKIKFIVNQNREAYLAFIAIFLLDIEKINKEEEIEKNIEKIRKSLDNFTRQSARSYYIVNELIGKELKNITEKLKEIDELLGEFVSKNLELIARIKNISKLDEKIKDLLEKKKFEKEIEKNSLLIKEKKNEYEKKFQMLKEDIEKIKSSDDFKKSVELGEKIQIKEREIFDLSCFISQEANFKILDKYSYYSPENKKIIDKFKDNSLEILPPENEGQFLRIVKECINLINQEKIQVKQWQKEKIIKSLMGLDKEKIKELREKHDSLKKELESLKKMENPIRINEKQDDLDKISSEIKILEKEICLEEEKKGKLTGKIKEETAEIENSIHKIFNKRVKITNIV